MLFFVTARYKHLACFKSLGRLPKSATTTACHRSCPTPTPYAAHHQMKISSSEISHCTWLSGYKQFTMWACAE